MAVKIIIALLIISGFLAGIRLMQKPRTALWGNRLGALSMLAAVIYTINMHGMEPLSVPVAIIAIGVVAGLILGQQVKMIQMPQTVALLNGLGGAASALIAYVALNALISGVFFNFTALLAVSLGTLTLGGSMIAIIKLHGSALNSFPRINWLGRLLNILILLTLFFVVLGSLTPETVFFHFAIIITALLAGLLMAVRIGGADMPVTISLLNAFSGIAASLAGIAAGNLILTGTGALVGVAGLILTRIMCRAMNRSLLAVLAGFTSTVSAKKPIGDPENVNHSAETGNNENRSSLESLIGEARSVIIIPGYGMAIAQAQTAVAELAAALEAKNKMVKFAVHPVAGRMPGHMNVLLAEAGIDYDKLLDLESANQIFQTTDLVIAVGACDVINPAANSVENCPISGMPILEAEKAGHVIIFNLDDRPGYSGVKNLLYEKNTVTTIWGNASETIPTLTTMIR